MTVAKKKKKEYFKGRFISLVWDVREGFHEKVIFELKPSKITKKHLAKE